MFGNLKLRSLTSSAHGGFPQLPELWRYERLRSVATLKVSGVDKLTVDGEVPVRLCNYTDVYKNDYIVNRPDYMPATATPAEIERFRLKPGDVVITKDSETWNDIAVPAYVVDAAPDLICAYHLAIVRPRKSLLQGSFLHHSLREARIANQFHMSAGGVTRFGLTQDAIKSAQVPVPPLEEQSLIVKYLAHAHARIDRAIAAKRKLIALLEEQKQAIIQQAVTRGLDPSVPLKDSGIPWLGAIPVHWQVRRAKYVLDEVDVRSSSGFEVQLSVSHITGVSPRKTTVTMFRAESYVGHKVCQPGDLVVNTMWAWMGALGIPHEAGIVSPSYGVYRPNSHTKMHSDFLGLMLRTPSYISYFKSESTGIRPSRLRLYPYQVLSTPLLIPPASEQTRILDHLDNQGRAFDKFQAKISEEIKLLREFRTRLTSDVVTGHVDIREIAETLPELTDDMLSSPTGERFGDDDATESERELADANE